MLIATSSLLAASSTIFAAAVSLQNIMPRSTPILWYCRFPNFSGPLCEAAINRENICVELPIAFQNGIESIEVSDLATCQFYHTINCTGESVTVEGVIDKMPKGWIDNTSSYNCTDKPQ